MNAHDFSFQSIDGAPLPLLAWAGRPVMVVNTASYCGYTPQYAGLEKLSQTYRDRGFVLLGVPSNDFGEQEPGTEAQIKAFCATFSVSFPLTRKEKVLGADAHPFFRWVASEPAGAPCWNFHKYLIGGDGRLAAGWVSSAAPQSKEVVAAIEAALAAKS